jgi:hypothetical protein
MSALLYLGAVSIFVLLAFWAYRAERPGAPKDGGGWFSLADAGEAEERAAPAGLRTHHRGQVGERASPHGARPEAGPAWRRSPSSKGPAARG